MWISQGEYISLCATEKTQGFYFSYFWCLYNISQAVGNGVGGYLLTNVNGSEFFLIMGTAMACISIGFLFLLDPVPIEGEAEASK